jgi:hypothetical protein
MAFINNSRNNYNSGNNNSTSGNFNNVNVSTRLAQFYNSEVGDDSSTATLVLWKDYLIINMHPMLDKAERKDGKMFDYDVRSQIFLDMNNIILLNEGLKIIEKEEKNAKEGKPVKITSVAVESNWRNSSTGSNSRFILKVGGPHNGEYDGIENYYMSIIEMSQSNEVESSIFFIFPEDTTGLLLNFNEDENKFKSKSYNSDWRKFKNIISYLAENTIMGSMYGVVRELSGQFNKLTTLIEEINGGSSSSRNNMNNNVRLSGSRRKRSSISLDESDLLSEDDIDNSSSGDDETDLFYNSAGSEVEIDLSKISNSRKSTKSGKPAVSKKLTTIEEIANDMQDELDDDLGDL